MGFLSSPEYVLKQAKRSEVVIVERFCRRGGQPVARARDLSQRGLQR
jgi:hypothetical protein